MKASTIAIIGLGVLAIAAMSRRQNQTAASNQNALNSDVAQIALDNAAGVYGQDFADQLEQSAHTSANAGEVFADIIGQPTPTGQWINGVFVEPQTMYDLNYLNTVHAAVPTNTTPHYVAQWEYDVQARLYTGQLEKARNSADPARRAYFEQIAARTLAELNAMVVRQ